MSQYRIQPHSSEKGFTLLLAAMMSVIILMVGMTILNTAFKQVTLTEIATDSERAFHAAYAGVECAQFWNVDDVWDHGGVNETIRCADLNVTTDEQYDGAANNPAYENARRVTELEIDWSSLGADDSYNQCTKLTVYKYYRNSGNTIMTVLPNYTDGFNRICPQGVECTVVVSRGYSRACGSLGSVRTVEREVIVRF